MSFLYFKTVFKDLYQYCSSPSFDIFIIHKLMEFATKCLLLGSVYSWFKWKVYMIIFIQRLPEENIVISLRENHHFQVKIFQPSLIKRECAEWFVRKEEIGIQRETCRGTFWKLSDRIWFELAFEVSYSIVTKENVSFWWHK